MRTSLLLVFALLTACSSGPATLPNQALLAQNATPPTTPPAPMPQAPLQVRWHRYVHRMMQPPGGPADIGQVVAAKLAWERKLLDPVALIAAASDEPSLNLIHEEPVLSARGMRIALTGEAPVMMEVGDSDAGDSIIRRQPTGVMIRRTGLGDEHVEMDDPYMVFDSPGSDRDMRMEYSEERVRLTGRSRSYEIWREGEATVLKTPRGRMTLTPKPDGLDVYENIENGLLGGKTTLIRESGKVISFDRPGTRDDLSVTTTPDSVSVASPNILHPFTLTRKGSRIEVKYPTNTWRNFSVTLTPDKIEIDRNLWGDDVTITRKGNQVKIDHFLYQNDATITREGNKLNRRHWFASMDAWLQGVSTPDYILEEGGMTFHVTPAGIQPLSLALDHGLDVLL